MGKRRSYKGHYTPKNKCKYIGDKSKIVWRSLWERSFCKWCDNNIKVVKWVIEPFAIPYFDKGNNKSRRYYPDFFIEMANGKKYLIEIKPDHETKPPQMKKGTKRYLLAEQTFYTNQSKWETAERYCESKGWGFRVITEHTLKSMGIKIITSLPKKKVKRRRISKKKK